MRWPSFFALSLTMLFMTAGLVQAIESKTSGHSSSSSHPSPSIASSSSSPSAPPMPYETPRAPSAHTMNTPAASSAVAPAVPSNMPQTGMAHNTPSSYSDKVFLSGMIAHHEGAVDMAKTLLNMPGKKADPKVTAWAKAILQAQEQEITLMRDLLKANGGLDDKAYKTMQNHMHAMMTAPSSTPKADRLFIEQMLPHHAQALEMSAPALEHSTNPALLDLAKNILVSQTTEMRAFKAWLATQR